MRCAARMDIRQTRALLQPASRSRTVPLVRTMTRACLTLFLAIALPLSAGCSSKAKPFEDVTGEADPASHATAEAQAGTPTQTPTPTPTTTAPPTATPPPPPSATASATPSASASATAAAATASASATTKATATSTTSATSAPATITTAASATPTTAPPTATPKPPTASPVPPSPTPAKPTATPANACDPSYPTVCIPAYPPDLDCGDVGFKNFKVIPPDRHGFDRDGDGIGCES